MRIAILLTILFCTSYVYVASAQDPSAGITAWVLGGDGEQEVRLGYEGFVPDIELALGLQHLDAVDPGIEEWPVRAYVIGHALDANMVASLLGGTVRLPKGEIYAGLFAEYTYDRAHEWSGGYILGGAVDWPKGWQVVMEYQARQWNVDDGVQQFMVGLRRKF
jgi:hypothetical protein